MKSMYRTLFHFTPVIGIVLYAIIYSYAVTFFPGGSASYPNAIGFSYMHNLLCDAMDYKTIANVINPARPIAGFGHVILSIAMIIFFYLLPKVFTKPPKHKKIIRVFGMISMISFIFLSSNYHDFMVNVTAFFGTIAMFFYLYHLRKMDNTAYKIVAFVSFGMSFLVFLSFVTKVGIYYLPAFQKITFLADVVWVLYTCFIIHKNETKAL